MQLGVKNWHLQKKQTKRQQQVGAVHVCLSPGQGQLTSACLQGAVKHSLRNGTSSAGRNLSLKPADAPHGVQSGIRGKQVLWLANSCKRNHYIIPVSSIYSLQPIICTAWVL